MSRDLCERFDKLTRGEWHSLLEEALAEDNRGISKTRTSTLEARERAACQKVQLGAVSREPVNVWLAPASRQAQRRVSGQCRTGALRKW